MTGAVPAIGSANWREFASVQVDPAQWSAIVPAAGRGSRLGFHRPKILFPVAGRLILDWLLDFLGPNCSQVIAVLSPDGNADVRSEMGQRIPGRFEIAIQTDPTGMGDAVRLALPHVRTPNVLIVWGDQVALRRSNVEACMRVHEGRLQPDLTFPTVIRDKPYIHFERDASGAIVGLRQAREGDAMPETGESDAGLFCFRTAVLSELLERMRGGPGAELGHRTGEFNLLPVIPVAARQGRVVTPRLLDLEETVGVNSREDAKILEGYLRDGFLSNSSERGDVSHEG